MNKTYDVVIIGGGLLGCTSAYYLCKNTDLNVALIERGMLGMQTSSLAASLVTRGRATRPLIDLCVETFEAVSELEDLLGDKLDFNHVGSMHVAQSVESATAIAKQTEMLRQMGDHPVELTIDQAREKVPWLSIDQVDYIVFNPKDGFIDPYRLCAAYMQGAKASGNLDVYQSTEVLELVKDGAKVTTIKTDQGDFVADQIVVAAGPWINTLLQPLGSGAAMAPVRSHYWITATDPLYPVTSPVVILPEAKAYARPEVGGLLFGLRDQVSKWAHPTDLPNSLQGFSFDEDYEGWTALEEAVEPFLEVCPSIGKVDIHHYISGPSGYTPDGKHVIGKAPHLSNVFLASGCCGAGVAISGGVGQSIHDLVTGQTPRIDLTDFAPDRFGDFDPYDEAFLTQCAASRSQKKAG
ncbi:NAD(P)/FAD-dependent oxidoreductase [Terasakiella pusilla]|uniref:NAD(P)/FAD-dependent oxidoreductase n=1 Tax=Terasakiella pusilla TaxID=64973 RepID=UPI00048FCDE6|nr:FAD-binding oxidoreductase [Terasakiella pusilla]